MSSKTKNSKPKQLKSRPAAASNLAQPILENVTAFSDFSSFSQSGEYFALLSQGADRHRLRVFSTSNGLSVAEHILKIARVTSLKWDVASSSDPLLASQSSEETGSPPPKKKAKRKSLVEDGLASQRSARQVVLLGLDDGRILFFSPNHGRVIRTLRHPSSTAAVNAMQLDEGSLEDVTSVLWVTTSDNSVSLWDPHREAFLGSWKSHETIPYHALASRATPSSSTELLLANYAIEMFSIQSTSNLTLSGSGSQPEKVCSFVGHASPICQLLWCHSGITSRERPDTVISTAYDDRFVQVWETPGPDVGSSSEGILKASISLDGNVQHIALSGHTSASDGDAPSLLALSKSGKIFIYRLDLRKPPKNGTSVQTLRPQTTVAVKSSESQRCPVVDAIFLPGDNLRIRIARVAGGLRPLFHDISLIDDQSRPLPEIRFDAPLAPQTDLDASEIFLSSTQRYQDPSGSAIRTGDQLPQDPSKLDKRPDGELDVDLAELSLGQRLTAMNGVDGLLQESSSDAEPRAGPSKTQRNQKGKKTTSENDLRVPAHSLSRTLIQALHSGDSALLESCIRHSDPALVQNTVRAVPNQLAVPLLAACTERLGRGKRGSNPKGGAGGASSQRGSSLVTWIRAVLVAHSGHLMTMPDLVARLSNLHATLTNRLLLQEHLLKLDGRLDLVLSQIELRSSSAPSRVFNRQGASASSAVRRTEPYKYVEGESTDDDEMSVEVEEDNVDDAGSVEDIELGGESSGGDTDASETGDVEDDESEDSDEEEDSEELSGDDDTQLPLTNGFIDDEAEETWSEGTDEDVDDEGDEQNEDEDESD